MADRFCNFDALSREMVKDVDYRIVCRYRTGSPVTILAPHGGKIEPHTSEIAQSIAGNVFSFYAFEGIRHSGNADLHITSHRFDEPSALRIANRCVTVVAVHGRKNNGDADTVYLGGLNRKLVSRLAHELDAGGFHSKSYVPGLSAKSATNICNRSSSGEGAQLELPYSLRENLARNEDKLNRFSNTVRRAIRHLLANHSG